MTHLLGTALLVLVAVAPIAWHLHRREHEEPAWDRLDLSVQGLLLRTLMAGFGGLAIGLAVGLMYRSWPGGLVSGLVVGLWILEEQRRSQQAELRRTRDEGGA